MKIGVQLDEIEALERAQKALVKAKRQDEKKIANGHRWFTVSRRTKILVECDSSGKPTERGKRQLECIKANAC